MKNNTPIEILCRRITDLWNESAERRTRNRMLAAIVVAAAMFAGCLKYMELSQ